jgi:hypothetical protein
VNAVSHRLATTLRRFLLIFGLPLALVDCLGWHGFRAELQNYSGGNVSVMVERFGAPERSIDLPGNPVRVAYTWKISDRAGRHVCDVTAIADKQSGTVTKVTDNCPDAR